MNWGSPFKNNNNPKNVNNRQHLQTCMWEMVVRKCFGKGKWVGINGVLVAGPTVLMLAVIWQQTVCQPQMYSNSKHATWRRSLRAGAEVTHPHTHTHRHRSITPCKSTKCTPFHVMQLFTVPWQIWAEANLITKWHGGSCKKTAL